MADKELQELQEEEEAKLRQKYPNLSRKGLGSSVLQKRLNRGGPKYFDSGDYNMAKARAAPLQLSVQDSTGGTIPSPETVPALKTPAFPVEMVTGPQPPQQQPQPLLQQSHPIRPIDAAK